MVLGALGLGVQLVEQPSERDDDGEKYVVALVEFVHPGRITDAYPPRSEGWWKGVQLF